MPAVAVEELVAEILKEPTVKCVGAALGAHGDDAAGIPSTIRSQNTTLYTKFSNAIWSGDRAVNGIELGVLQLVSIYRDARAVHLSARDGVGVAIVGNQISLIPQGGNLVAEWSLALNLWNHAGQIQ